MVIDPYLIIFEGRLCFSIARATSEVFKRLECLEVLSDFCLILHTYRNHFTHTDCDTEPKYVILNLKA